MQTAPFQQDSEILARPCSMEGWHTVPAPFQPFYHLATLEWYRVVFHPGQEQAGSWPHK